MYRELARQTFALFSFSHLTGITKSIQAYTQIIIMIIIMSVFLQ